MTDEELIKRLRSQVGDDVQHIYDHEVLFKFAADRIAELAAANRGLVRLNETTEAENHLLKTSGIIEVAARNPNVMEYIKHWDDKVEEAEAKLEKAVETMGEAIYLLTFEELTGGKDE